MTWRIASSVLDELELTFGEDVFAVCELGSARLGCVIVPDDPSDSVILAEAAGSAWIECRRFEWLDGALEALGSLLDSHWHEVPVDEPGWPSPTLVIPRGQLLEVLYRTVHGVYNAAELSDRPGQLIHHESMWPNFRSATKELSDWSAYLD